MQEIVVPQRLYEQGPSGGDDIWFFEEVRVVSRQKHLGQNIFGYEFDTTKIFKSLFFRWHDEPEIFIRETYKTGVPVLNLSKRQFFLEGEKGSELYLPEFSTELELLRADAVFIGVLASCVPSMSALYFERRRRLIKGVMQGLAAVQGRVETRNSKVITPWFEEELYAVQCAENARG